MTTNDAEHRTYEANDVLYPNVTVQLTGIDGNAFAILGKVQKALRANGCTDEQVAEYNTEATSGDYDNLLRVTMRTVDVI